MQVLPEKSSSLIKSTKSRIITVPTNSRLTCEGGAPSDTLFSLVKKIYHSPPLISDEYHVWHAREIFQFEDGQVYIPNGARENRSATFRKVCRWNSVNVHSIVHGIVTNGIDIQGFDIYHREVRRGGARVDNWLWHQIAVGGCTACGEIRDGFLIDEAPGTQEPCLGGKDIHCDVRCGTTRWIDGLKLILKFNKIGFGQVRLAENLAN